MSPFVEACDLVGVDVADDDVVAEVGQARAGRQPDVAGADDADAAHHAPHRQEPFGSGGPKSAGFTPVPLPVA